MSVTRNRHKRAKCSGPQEHAATTKMGKKRDGPKRIGTTKPPPKKSHKTTPPPLPKSKIVGKKQHRAAANAAAWALIGADANSGKQITGKKKGFSY